MASRAASAKRCRGGSRGIVENCSAIRWWGCMGLVGGGGSIEWEDWARRPRSTFQRSGGAVSVPLSLDQDLFLRCRTGGSQRIGVGRPTTPPGACPESARMLYRARLITSRGVPQWFTAANFSAGRRTTPNSFLRGARLLVRWVWPAATIRAPVAPRSRTLTDSGLSVAYVKTRAAVLHEVSPNGS